MRSSAHPPTQSKNFCHLDLREQVSLARASAEYAIAQGLEGHASDHPNNDLWEMVCLITRQPMEELIESEDTKLLITNVVYAARAIGLAQGLLLRPEMFSKPHPRGLKGGAR